MPKPPAKRGRPKVTIDWDRVGKLFEAGATATGVAASVGCSVDTLSARCRTDLNLDLSVFRQEKKAKGDELLRAKQFSVAMSGDKTMLIWLGKQRLEQTDKQQTELTGKDGGPIHVQSSMDLSRLSKDELMMYESLLKKANG